MTSRAQRIETALRTAFAPQSLAVQDESAMHAGHAGASSAGETHYQVVMESGHFSGMARIARSRAVHAALALEFASGLHALSLRLKAPGE